MRYVIRLNRKMAPPYVLHLYSNRLVTTGCLSRSSRLYFTYVQQHNRREQQWTYINPNAMIQAAISKHCRFIYLIFNLHSGQHIYVYTYVCNLEPKYSSNGLLQACSIIIMCNSHITQAHQLDIPS